MHPAPQSQSALSSRRLSEARFVLRHSRALAEEVIKDLTPLDRAEATGELSALWFRSWRYGWIDALSNGDHWLIVPSLNLEAWRRGVAAAEQFHKMVTAVRASHPEEPAEEEAEVILTRPGYRRTRHPGIGE